jgi:hypothetical protein
MSNVEILILGILLEIGDYFIILSSAAFRSIG